VEQVNKYLDGLDWLSLAGVSQCVRSAAERDKIVSYASHWLCLGRTRVTGGEVLVDLGIFLLTAGNTWLREVTSGERPTIPLGIITLLYV